MVLSVHPFLANWFFIYQLVNHMYPHQSSLTRPKPDLALSNQIYYVAEQLNHKFHYKLIGTYPLFLSTSCLILPYLNFVFFLTSLESYYFHNNNKTQAGKVITIHKLIEVNTVLIYSTPSIQILWPRRMLPPPNMILPASSQFFRKQLSCQK